MASAYGESGYGDGGYGGTTMTKTATATVTLSEEGELTVNVEDVGGNPIEAATVEIASASGDVVETQDTDTNGQAVFAALPVEDYDVTVDKDGFFAESTTVAAGDFT